MPFPALNGVPVEVLAVLERTAVVVSAGEERRLVRLDSLSVDPQIIRWHQLKGTVKGNHWASSERGRALSRRSKLRKEGKGLCPRCPEGVNIHPRIELNGNGYCKPCAVKYGRERRAIIRAGAA